MLDQIDTKILRELQADGRLSWVELAERVHLSATACQRRVQAMFEKGIIDGISARINPEALGYEVEAYVSVYVDRQDVELAQKFRKAIRDYPEVQTCHMITGQVDYQSARKFRYVELILPIRKRPRRSKVSLAVFT